MSAQDPTTTTSDRIIGLDIVSRETKQVIHTVLFAPDEVEMPGYVESVIRGYEHTPDLTPVKVWRTTLDPAEIVTDIEAIAALLNGAQVALSRAVTNPYIPDKQDRQLLVTSEATLTQARLLLSRLSSKLPSND